jgi:hypothetical protein
MIARERLMRALRVSADELDELIGTDPANAAALEALVDLLEVKLKPSRLPTVVRQAAPVFGGRSMLTAIADGQLDQVLAAVRASFEWERPA